MDLRFDGKIAIITGGTTGIGLATVKEFCDSGATVIFTGSEKDFPDHFVIPAGSSFYNLDSTDQKSVKLFADSIISTYGGADILVNNTESYASGLLHNCEVDQWNRIFSNNVTGTFLCCKYFLPQMLHKKKGAIINVCSIAGLQGENNAAVYSAAEGAIANMTRAMAVDYAPFGIRINAVNPGLVRTTSIYDSMASLVGNADILEHGIQDVYPLGRSADPSEIAAAIIFLASEEANFVIGHNLSVDGGLTCWTGAQYKWDRVKKEYEEKQEGLSYGSQI